MPYTPDPTDASQPTEDKFVETAAPEFRALKARVNALEASIGGGGAVLGGTPISDFSITPSTPDLRVSFPDTNPLTWNSDVGKFSLQFDFTANNLWTLNPNCHFAVVTRCDTSLLTTAVRGTGVAIGVLPAENRVTGPTPVVLTESWVNGIGPGGRDNWLLPRTEFPPDIGIGDGVLYRMAIHSTKDVFGNRFIRYQLWRRDTVNSMWVVINDTGDVYDPSVQADLTKYGLAFGIVGTSAGSGWSIAFTNIRCVWGPVSTMATDVSDKATKRGTYLDGKLFFPRFDNLRQASIDLTSANQWDFSTVGVSGQAAPTYRFLYAGDAKATITSSGLTIKGATRALGRNTANMLGVYAEGGTDATTISNTPFDFETMSNSEEIAAYLGPTYNANLIAGFLARLGAYISVMYYNGKTNGTQ